jgi:hypothetical protein
MAKNRLGLAKLIKINSLKDVMSPYVIHIFLLIPGTVSFFEL